MHHKVTVEVTTPNWQYCDLQNPYSSKHKTGQRCRFCIEHKARGQNQRCFCALFNVELKLIGDMVEKTSLCYQDWKRNQIIDLTTSLPDSSASVDSKEVTKMIQQSIKQLRKQANTLEKSGIPTKQAWDAATQLVIEEWKGYK